MKIENPVEYGFVLYGVFLYLMLLPVAGLFEGNTWEEDHLRADLAKDEIAGLERTSHDVLEILHLWKVRVD